MLGVEHSPKMSGQNAATEAPTIQRNRPKRRWPWAVGTVCLVIAILYLATPNSIWDGKVQRTIRVHVTDNSGGYPVSGATVTLLQAHDYAITEHLGQAATAQILQSSNRLAITNERGEATVQGQFGAGGSVGLLWLGGAFTAEGVLTISHPKYQTAEGMLPNYLQRKEFPIRTNKLDVQIFLAPK